MSGRDRLLEAAWALVARRGDARPEELAREAGVSKALVFHHFRSLDGLRDAMAARVLRETQAGLDALADEQRDPRARLDALARALLTEPPEPPAVARRVLSFWLAEDARGEPRAAARDALVADFVEKTMKEARSRADARAVAGLLLSRWHGATAVYASGGYVDFEAEQERTRGELERML